MRLKKSALLVSFLVLLGLVVACSGVPASSETDRIEPGDTIGDFTITTGVAGNFTYGFSIQCSQLEQGTTYRCEIPIGEAINVSTGLLDTTGSGKLDEVWAHSNYQMFINDRPLDLEAFGTIDYAHPQMGKIRFANVVIKTEKPGEITVRDTGLYDNGDPFSSSSTYVFSEH